MSLEKKLEANTAALVALTAAIQSNGLPVSGKVVELVSEPLDQVKVETTMVAPDDTTETKEVETKTEEVETQSTEAPEDTTSETDEDIPAAEDRPFALKSTRRPTQVVKLEKAEKSGNPEEIAECKLALCEFNISKAKREITRLKNIKAEDAKQAQDQADAVRYAEHDLAAANTALEAIKAITTTEEVKTEEVKAPAAPVAPKAPEVKIPAAPAAPKIDTRGAPVGFKLTDLAQPVELQYADYVESGWTDDLLQSEGLMEAIPESDSKPSVEIDIDHLREQMVQLTQSKGGAALTATIGKYASSLEEIAPEDYDDFLDDLQLLPNVEA